MSAETNIQVSFLGGASAIGASCALVQVADTSVLVDCGVRFKSGHALPDLDQLTGKKLDAIIVTHAHSDHTGALPVIHEAYPSTPIYMTPPTQDLVTILQKDALKIMGMGSEREGDIPLYSERQVQGMLQMLRPIHHGNRVEIKDIEVVYLPASHILGASMVYLSTPAGNILFTGDYSIGAQKTVPALDRPSLVVDMIVTETTYGNRLHADRKTAESRLIQRISEITEHGGRVLIPAFAIGRAQEVLLILKQALRHQKIPDVPVFVDGMVRLVCGVYKNHGRYVTRSLFREIKGDTDPFFSNSIQPVVKPDDRKKVVDAGPCVIVSSSGMLNGGPSVFYATHLASQEKDAILITGYQDEESPGRALLNLAERKEQERNIKFGEKEVDVRCLFETYSLSAHADRIQMVGFLESLKPRTVVLVHGDAEAKQTLAKSLSCKDIVFAEDGDQMTRRYPRRKDPILDVAPEEIMISPEAVAALIGPATGEPLQVSALCESWFGKKVDRRTQERFVQKLEETGIVRRDDERRSILWPLTKSAANPEISLEEALLAETLKNENPKGRLLELCMRRQFPKPEMTEASDNDGVHIVEFHLDINGKKYSSGVQRGFTKKVAEQLAARELLARLTLEEKQIDLIEISEDQKETLDQSNPKGRLLELCSQLKISAPQLFTEAVVGAYHGWGVYTLPDQTVFSTKRYKASRAKISEQAAALEILEYLSSSDTLDMILKMSESVSSFMKDARGELNEMRQQRIILDFDYALKERKGPSHQPIFVLIAWAKLPDGSRIETEAIEERNKKMAQQKAAQRLLELLLGSVKK